MSDFDPDNLSENEWEENGDLAWNEFDWERYLREQDRSIDRYLGYYEALKAGPERIDEVADRMGWDRTDAEEGEDRENPEKTVFSDEIYTLQKNPVFIATKALFLTAAAVIAVAFVALIALEEKPLLDTMPASRP